MAKETGKTAGTVYEVAFHIVPTVSPENLPKEVDAIKAVLGKAEATIVSEEAPALRELAYTMIKVIGPNRHRFDTAHFGWIKFEASTEAVGEIKKALDASDKIIRFLIVKTVRENTLYGAKIAAAEAAKKEAAAKEAAEKADADAAAKADKATA